MFKTHYEKSCLAKVCFFMFGFLDPFNCKIIGVGRNASLVQLVERWSPKPNVEGSSPSGRVKNKILNKE